MFSKKTVIVGAISCLFLFSPVTMAKEVVVQEARDGVAVVDTDSIYEIERGRFTALITLKYNDGEYESCVIKYKLFNDGWRYYGKLSKTPLNLHGIILGENQCIKEHYWLASHT